MFNYWLRACTQCLFFACFFSGWIMRRDFAVDTWQGNSYYAARQLDTLYAMGL